MKIVILRVQGRITSINNLYWRNYSLSISLFHHINNDTINIIYFKHNRLHMTAHVFTSTQRKSKIIQHFLFRKKWEIQIFTVITLHMSFSSLCCNTMMKRVWSWSIRTDSWRVTCLLRLNMSRNIIKYSWYKFMMRIFNRYKDIRHDVVYVLKPGTTGIFRTF